MPQSDSTGHGAPPVAGARLVEIDQIKMGDAKIDEARVNELADSINEVGLINPIVILPNWRLVAGRHRVEACRALGHSAVLANVLDLDELHAQIAGIDENLVRRPMTALERGEMSAERKRIYEQLHPESRVGGAPGKKGGGKRPKNLGSRSFVADTSKKTGRGRATVAEDVRIGELPSEVRDALRGTPFENNKSELTRLCQLEPTQAIEVANQLRDGAAKSVAEALEKMAPPQPEKDSTCSTKPLIFQDQDDMNSAVGHLREGTELLGRVIKGWQTEVGLDVAGIIGLMESTVEKLRELTEEIDSEYVPHAECDPCQGENCQVCCGAGWLSKAQVQARESAQSEGASATQGA